ncbi:MAG: sugar kinase [Acidimicrobiales bacterium]
MEEDRLGLGLRSAAECRFELLALGEVMLRLDPGDGRIRTARQFRAWEGGGEYNVARGLSRVFGKPTAIVTALADNDVGRLIEGFMLQGGVDVSLVRWRPYDGLGRTVRNGLNFTERGFGVRAALGVSDRGNTAAGQMTAGEIDWDTIFGQLGVQWLHTGGIFAGLSATTPGVIEEAISAAHRHGTVVSYDLNYRASLWRDFGGEAQARLINRHIVEQVDVLFGNEEDFTVALGFDVPGSVLDGSALDPSAFKSMIGSVTDAFPNLKVVATTLRAVKSASLNDWGAVGWMAGRCLEATPRPGLAIYDRVGGGDGFVSGLIYGLMETADLAEALELGAAHGALAMTTPGDTSMATLAEVRSLASGGGARISR